MHRSIMFEKMRLFLLLCFLVCMKCKSQVHAIDDASEQVSCVPSLTRSSSVNGNICKGALIFEDNFDFLDLSKWSHEVTMAGGGNYEFQIYWADGRNSYTDSSTLHLVPGKTADIHGIDFLYNGTIDLGSSCSVDWNYGCVRTGSDPYILNPVTSAQLHTTTKFTFTYGLVEVRAKAPAGDWLWPAIWMMPQNSEYGQWPTSGEIDIMELRGNRHLYKGGVNIGVERVANTIHWGPDPNTDLYKRTRYQTNSAAGQGYNNDYHLYQVEWTPDYIKFMLDNNEVGRVTPPAGGFYELGDLANQGYGNPWASGTKMAPFDKEFFIILNLAIGGHNYFPECTSNPGNKPWVNDSPTSFKEFWEGRAQWEPTWWGDGSTNFNIDYVRVWAL